MASWQAHLSVWIVKWRVKRRLRGVRDYRHARRILNPDPYTVPISVRISPAQVGGVSGEWVDGASAAKTVLLYLHGGGYFGCSADRIVPSPWRLRSRDFAFLRQTIASRQKISFLLPSTTRSPLIVVFSARDIRPNELWSAGIPRAAVLRFRSCSRFAIQGFRFQQERLFFRRGRISPPRAIPSARMRIAAPCSMGRTLVPARATTWVTRTRAIRWLRRSMPISRVFRRFSSMLAKMKFCATIPRVLQNVRKQQVFALS